MYNNPGKPGFLFFFQFILLYAYYNFLMSEKGLREKKKFASVFENLL